MDIQQSVIEFQRLISSVQPNSVIGFLNWVKENLDDILENVSKEKKQNDDIILDSIREDLRQSLPVNAMSPSESMVVPSFGANKDCTPDTTVHVDAFLYDEDAIDDLCDKGLMSRNYCVSCGSKMVKPLTFITHSASVKQIQYIYQYLLPDLRGKTVLDVGSRTGAVLYGAYVYSEASNIIGVEIDANFCQLQNNIIQKYGFNDRIQVFHKNVMECQELLHQSDVIILNNVFEFFMEQQLQQSIWNFLYQTIQKKNTIIITVPSIEESIKHLQTNININSWLKLEDLNEVRSKANLTYYESSDSEDSDLDSIYMYHVL